jgi:hypothetical protein
VTDAWLPGAQRLPAASDGGSMQGGAPRVTWQALGADPHRISARSAAQRLDQLDRACHLVWNPLTGEIVQLIPVVRAARSLGWPEGLAAPAGHDDPGPAVLARGDLLPDGLAGVNAEGRVCVQIGVIAFAWEPFTSGPLRGLAGIVRWLDSWGVRRAWPAGPPRAFPHGHAAQGARRLWARGGHFGASQVPGTAADGPGAIDTERLTGPAIPVAERRLWPRETRLAGVAPAGLAAGTLAGARS